MEALDLGLLLRGIGPARGEGHLDIVAGSLCGLLDTDRTTQNDQIGDRDILARAGLDILIDLEHPGQFFGLIDVPVLLRGQANATAVGAAAVIRPAIGRGRGPCRANQVGNRQVRGRDRVLQVADVSPRQGRSRMGRDRILPDQIFGRDLRAEVAGLGPHVAVAQLEPGAGELVGEIGRISPELLHDLAVFRVEFERHVGGRHHRRHPLARRVRCRGQGIVRIADRLPLLGASRAADQLIVMIQKHVEIGHVPGNRGGGPGAFDARGDGVVAHAALVARNPAHALLGDVGPFGTGADLGGIARAVGLAEGVTARRQGRRFLIIHPHPTEGLADVAGRLQGVRHPAGAFWVHIDQAHLDSGQRFFQRHVLVGLDAGLIALLADPLFLGAPIDILFGLPDVGAAAAESEHRPAHRLDGDIPGQDHQIRPAQIGTILLLDRPQQAPGLVQIAVVRPAVQRGKALLAGAGAAAPVRRAIGAGGVPGHANEEGAIVAIVRRPPGLAVGHQGMQVALDCRVVQFLERLGVVELVAHRIAGPALLVQDVDGQMVRPPVAIGAAQKRTQRAAFLLGVAEGVACVSVHALISRGFIEPRCESGDVIHQGIKPPAIG